MLAHIYYLFIYVLTDTKNSNFCVMKVKDFIERIRPITTLDPETDFFTILEFNNDELKISSVVILEDKVNINFKIVD